MEGATQEDRSGIQLSVGRGITESFQDSHVDLTISITTRRTITQSSHIRAADHTSYDNDHPVPGLRISAGAAVPGGADPRRPTTSRVFGLKLWRRRKTVLPKKLLTTSTASTGARPARPHDDLPFRESRREIPHRPQRALPSLQHAFSAQVCRGSAQRTPCSHSTDSTFSTRVVIFPTIFSSSRHPAHL